MSSIIILISIMKEPRLWGVEDLILDGTAKIGGARCTSGSSMPGLFIITLHCLPQASNSHIIFDLDMILDFIETRDF